MGTGVCNAYGMRQSVGAIQCVVRGAKSSLRLGCGGAQKHWMVHSLKTGTACPSNTSCRSLASAKRKGRGELPAVPISALAPPAVLPSDCSCCGLQQRVRLPPWCSRASVASPATCHWWTLTRRCIKSPPGPCRFCVYSYSDAAVEWSEKWFLCWKQKGLLWGKINSHECICWKGLFLCVACVFVFLPLLITKVLETVKYRLTLAFSKRGQRSVL